MVQHDRIQHTFCTGKLVR